MTEAILAATLSRYIGLYNVKLSVLVDQYGTLMSLYKLWQKNSNIPQLLQHQLDQAWTSTKLKSIEKDLEQNNITAFTPSDSAYPEMLLQISDKPYVIYCKGNSDYLHQLTLLSCVGTRAMSIYGKRAVSRIISGLHPYQIGVVSGLALGCDAEAHSISLANNIPTIAVLGGGLDRYEPVTNHHLGEKIAQMGCIVSEYPPGVRPQKHQFLERNRIIAGLAHATIVIEGREHSGSLVTARYALAYGREVGVVPGDIFSPNSQAPHILLRDGAWPITNLTDVLMMLNIHELSAGEKPRSDYGPVHGLLEHGAYSIDTLYVKLGIPLSEIQLQLTQLELRGTIAISPVGEYYLKA